MKAEIEEVPQGARGADSTTASRIFISYDRRDLDAVRTLSHELEAMGHRVWFDEDIAGGHRWWDTILTKIRECDLFIFALSPESVDSRACKKELDYASRLERRILPILLSGSVNENLLPRHLSEIQYVDYRRQDRQTAFTLIRAINSLPAPAPLTRPAP